MDGQVPLEVTGTWFPAATGDVAVTIDNTLNSVCTVTAVDVAPDGTGNTQKITCTAPTMAYTVTTSPVVRVTVNTVSDTNAKTIAYSECWL